MSRENPKENNNGDKITARDLFGSIPKPIDVDPFEGIDMEAINVLRRPLESEDVGVTFDEFNHLRGFDIADLSAGASRRIILPEKDDLVSLEGVDPDYIGLVKKPAPSNGKGVKHVKAPDSEDVGQPEALAEESPEIPGEPAVMADHDKIQAQTDVKKGGLSPESTLSGLLEKAKQFAKTIPITFKALTKKGGKATAEKRDKAVEVLSADRLKIGSVYSEVNRVRENIINALEKADEKTVVFISPHDGAGNTFMISLLGFNIAYFTKMKTLLVDLNMRRPELHLPFGLEREVGFTDIVSRSRDWKEVVKDTGFSELKIITAGKRDNELYLNLTPDLLENMIKEMKETYDLILLDSSPVLNKNRNNVDPVFLSFTCEMVVMVVQDKRTTSEQITQAVESITRDGGNIDGIVYNRQF